VIGRCIRAGRVHDGGMSRMFGIVVAGLVIVIVAGAGMLLFFALNDGGSTGEAGGGGTAAGSREVSAMSGRGAASRQAPRHDSKGSGKPPASPARPEERPAGEVDAFVKSFSDEARAEMKAFRETLPAPADESEVRAEYEKKLEAATDLEERQRLAGEFMDLMREAAREADEAKTSGQRAHYNRLKYAARLNALLESAREAAAEEELAPRAEVVARMIAGLAEESPSLDDEAFLAGYSGVCKVFSELRKRHREIIEERGDRVGGSAADGVFRGQGPGD